MPNIEIAFRSLARSALDLLLPVHCVGCSREGEVICASCIGGLKRLEHPFCDVCAQPNVQGTCDWCLENPPTIDGIHAPYLFDGPLRGAVHRLKYRGWRVAAPMLGGLLATYLEQRRIPGEILAPVPLHPHRLRSRGYNQSALLARETGKLLGMPVGEDLLMRTKDTLPQVDTGSGDHRRTNVAGSFLASDKAAGLSVLLVDDVVTTGSTLSACAAALKDAGAVSVRGIVLAREG